QRASSWSWLTKSRPLFERSKQDSPRPARAATAAGRHSFAWPPKSQFVKVANSRSLSTPASKEQPRPRRYSPLLRRQCVSVSHNVTFIAKCDDLELNRA